MLRISAAYKIVLIFLPQNAAKNDIRLIVSAVAIKMVRTDKDRVYSHSDTTLKFISKMFGLPNKWLRKACRVVSKSNQNKDQQ